MSLLLQQKILPIVLLGLSNIFMTFAWYGHLRFKGAALPKVMSWITTLVEVRMRSNVLWV